MSRYFDAPPDIVASLSSICCALPETKEEKAWAGVRWKVRNRTFAHVLNVDAGGREITVVTFRSAEPELDVLCHAGHPFFKAGWGHDVVGMVIDDHVDWEEAAELMTESYCVLAPKKLVAGLTLPEPRGAT